MILFSGSRKRRMQGKGRGRGERIGMYLIVKQVFMLVGLVYS